MYSSSQMDEIERTALDVLPDPAGSKEPSPPRVARQPYLMGENISGERGIKLLPLLRQNALGLEPSRYPAPGAFALHIAKPQLSEYASDGTPSTAMDGSQEDDEDDLLAGAL